MLQEKKIIKGKIGLIELGKQLGNVSEACRVLGYSRDSYYRFKELYDTGGEQALAEISRRKPNLENRMPTETEQAILEITLLHPTWGKARIANELFITKGIRISDGGVRCVWKRHDMTTMERRLRALEAHVAQKGGVLTEQQKIALEEAQGLKEAHGEFESECPGYCGAQDTFYVGNMKGVGRIYQQTFIDTYTKVGFAKLYTDKTPITSADLLNDRVLPFFEEHGIRLCRILTDRGGEFCGRPDLGHAYETYLALEEIEHSRTKAYSPQTNGICERFHRTMLDEFYRVAFRMKRYETLEAIQEDLDAWITEYNEKRTHQGRWCYGKTPMQTFLDSIPLAKEKQLLTAAAN